MAAPLVRVSGDFQVPAELRGGIVAIGNFDGLHRGHQEILGRVRELADQSGRPGVILTFSPHPRKLFQPDVPHFELTPPSMKARLAGLLGMDGVVQIDFTREFAGLSAEQFVEQILVRGLGVSRSLVGFDFHFGRNRQGGPAFLMQSGEEHGFGVTLVDAFRDEGAQVISSSRIRTLLEQGDLAEANGLLGYRYTVESTVIKGKQLGRTLSYPTANMALPTDTALREGVYAVRFRRPNGELHDGVASFGRRPTVTACGEPLLETHVFDFAGDLYGEECHVSFFAYLRPELKFDGLDPLVIQMKQDEAEARAALANVKPRSALDASLSF